MVLKSEFFCFILIITSDLVSPTRRNATRRPGAPHPRFSNTNEDYNDYYGEDLLSPATTLKPAGTPKPCHFDLCQDQQVSCHELAKATGCSCPGISGHFQPPDPPHLRILSSEAPGTVVVHWCAPASAVTHYVVLVGGQDEGRQAGERTRLMDLGDIAPGTEVCVQAVNRAGISARGSLSCARFEPRGPESGLALKLGLIGGAVVLAVVLVLALLTWRCRRRQKAPTRTGNRGA
ncbi:LRRN4 C-terminal-like protein [Trichomycterus rosablanca]|uniref:LRRN4 C-terminal-like protein n=1 Tax=Trichomycterus rosablanca TaxID=2290929 RepID=UPI002F355C33